MTNDFDKILEYTIDGYVIRYGIKMGQGSLVFVKTGLGGDIPGYEGKYLRIANRLNEKYGCTVICASNPIEVKCHAEIDRGVIDRMVGEMCSDAPRMYFFGHSNGGIKGLELTTLGVRFERMMLVNTPLMVNMFKTKAMINAILDTEVCLIYGALDPSVPYLPFFDGKIPNVRARVFAGADHNFCGFTNEFIELADELMGSSSC